MEAFADSILSGQSDYIPLAVKRPLPSSDKSGDQEGVCIIVFLYQLILKMVFVIHGKAAANSA